MFYYYYYYYYYYYNERGGVSDPVDKLSDHSVPRAVHLGSKLVVSNQSQLVVELNQFGDFLRQVGTVAFVAVVARQLLFAILTGSHRHVRRLLTTA